MARRKGRRKGAKRSHSRRRYYGRKRRGGRGGKHSAAVELGGLATGFKIATGSGANPQAPGSPWSYLKNPGLKLEDRLKYAGMSASANAVTWDNDKWVLYGMGLHWLKNKPVARIVLKPVDKLIKTIAGRRYGL